MMPETIRGEVAVIGSGPGGAVTAMTLASKGHDIILLEEGPHLRLDSCPPFSLEEMRQKYRWGGLNPALGAPKVPLVEACCVGGGSEINSGLYLRTPPEILDLWRDRFAVQYLKETDLAPHFDACESAIGVQLNPMRQPTASIKMKIGAERLGWKTIEVPRCFKYSEAPTPDGILRGKRQSMTETLVPSAQGLGCRLVPDTRVEKLERTRAHWRVKAIRKDESFTVEAEAVFVCCGAIETPALLRRSGIKKNIGNTLAICPMIKVAAVFEDEVNSEYVDIGAQQVREFSPHISIGCSISSLPYLAFALSEHPDAEIALRHQWRRMSIYYAAIAGPNVGVVRNVLLSRAPLIRYSLSAENLRSLSAGLVYLCRLLFAAGATHLYPGLSGMPALRSETDLLRIPAELPRERTNLTTVHLSSSCPMGEAPDFNPVDSFGRLQGYRDLFVNDASLLCTAPAVNPQGSIMALARRNALHFSKDL
jgi:choline dehydrogenase-like flavoprotein